jgi:probable phosphoglycerate mutase
LQSKNGYAIVDQDDIITGAIESEMKTIYLVRHGETYFNKLGRVQGWCDSLLTPLGEAQAKLSGEFFAKNQIGFDEVWTSDMGRTRKTAAIIVHHSKNDKAALRETPLLRETSFGRFEGWANDDMWQSVGRIIGKPDFEDSWPSAEKMNALAGIKSLDRQLNVAENLDDVEKRARMLLSKIAKSHCSVLLLVSHSLFISILLRVLGDPGVDHIPNGSITKMLETSGRFQLQYVGRTE